MPTAAHDRGPARRRCGAAAVAALVVGAAAAGQRPPAQPTVASVVALHLEARGGRERLAAVRSLLATGRLVSAASESAFTLRWSRPGKARLEIVTGARTMIEVVTGEAAWWLAPDVDPPQSGALPLDAAREIAERGDVDGILAHWRERGYAASLAGEEELDGERVVNVRLERDDETHRLSLSVRTHLVIRRVSAWGGGGTGVEVEARFFDFRTVDGVVIPFAMERRTGGALLHRVVVERVDLNPALDATLFVAPPHLATTP